jgi:hypothetical protein
MLLLLDTSEGMGGAGGVTDIGTSLSVSRASKWLWQGRECDDGEYGEAFE